MRKLPLCLLATLVLLAPSPAFAERAGAPVPAIAHGDAGEPGDLLVRGGVGVGSLFGCCGSDPFWSANLSLRAGVRLHNHLALGLQLDYRHFQADGKQADNSLLLLGQYWFWRRAYATLGVGVAHVVDNADNGAGPLFTFDKGAAAAAGVGIELPLHRRAAVTFELTESLTRYGGDIYHATTLSAGFTFGTRVGP